MQRADEEGDLFYHGQVLLQVLQLLEESRGAEVHLIWIDRDPSRPQGWGGCRREAKHTTHCKGELPLLGYGTRATEGNVAKLLSTAGTDPITGKVIQVTLGLYKGSQETRRPRTNCACER